MSGERSLDKDSSINTRLRVLVVEDSEDDATLLLR